MIVKLFFAGVWHFADVHRLVTNVQAVRAERDFGRSEKLTHSEAPSSDFRLQIADFRIPI
jgi:hypothetical protein